MQVSNLTKATLAGLAVLSLTGGIIYFGVSEASAMNLTGRSTLIQNLAAKFGVSETDVEQVFTDTRKQEESSKLEELVSDGTITSEQKDLIIAKQEEVKTKMDAIRENTDLTEEERKTEMDALRDEEEAWATENNIPTEAIGKIGKGPRGDMPRMERPSETVEQ